MKKLKKTLKMKKNNLNKYKKLKKNKQKYSVNLFFQKKSLKILQILKNLSAKKRMKKINRQGVKY